jgi:type I restriction enzyme S subunit
MAAEWKEIPFSEAVLLNPTTPLKKGGVYPFVDMQAITPGARGVRCSEHREFTGGGSRFQNQDTLMARITPCLENGKIARFLAPDGESIGHGSTEFIVVRGRPSVTDNDYAYYLTISPEVRNFAISQMTGSSGRQRVPTDSLTNIDVPLPSLTEQRTIASVLGSLDDKIELNRRMNETLEALAQSLFKFWFVDATQSALPKGWEIKSLAEVTELITKGTTPTQEDVTSAPISDAQINFLRVNAIAEDGVILDEKLTKIPESVHTGVLKRSILKAGDVVYTIAGTIGRMSVVRENLLPVNCNQAVAIIRPKLDVPPGFLLLSMKQTAFQEELHSNIVHAVQANLSLGMLSRAKIAVPPKESFGRLFQPINDLLEKIDANREESRSLAALRDALLPKLLSGELRVPATAGKLAEAHA